MSIIFGLCATDGRPIEARELESLARATERYAPDGTWLQIAGNAGMGYQPYFTHLRSSLEKQPAKGERGFMLSFDGRLDNYKELSSFLGIEGRQLPDSEIVLAAFAHWGQECFAHMVGDWALALWSEIDQVLFLARDHVGSRTLYYDCRQELVLWATHLETFLAAAPNRPTDATYFACYLAGVPTRELTPYQGIRAVAPGHFVRITRDCQVQRPHWSWAANEPICYANEADYSEHFLALFEQSVERRTVSGVPVLAHLSGGMDSSSIVCISDELRRRKGAAPEDLLDTVSYFDDSEPHWDERPYFEAVEHKRGKPGIHLPLPLLSDGIEEAPVRYLWPGADRATYENERRLLEATRDKNYRVILSGIGGDELLGGVPNPLPQLADLLAAGDLRGYFQAAMAWCLIDRSPLLQMTGRALAFGIGQYWPARVGSGALPPWGSARMKDLVESASSEQFQLPSAWLRPSAMANLHIGAAIVETLPHRTPAHLVRHEWRYPYLDRDLVEFLLCIPPSVLVRPGRRRALMRTALREIVPSEVLERRRKGTRSRSIPSILRSEQERLARLFAEVPPALTGLVDPVRFKQQPLEVVRQSELTKMQFVVRALLVLLWTRTPLPASSKHSNLPPTRSSTLLSCSGTQALSAEHRSDR